ncbi:unnamed protein product [Amoebophrya sp. A25]|nr:unnamed protein product [Amoebophrya sp. A25]|eukprot:GSA25T00007139001.1
MPAMQQDNPTLLTGPDNPSGAPSGGASLGQTPLSTGLNTPAGESGKPSPLAARRRSLENAAAKNANQAKTQLWQLITGVIIPSGTEFAQPFTRQNAAHVSQWFRKLQSSACLTWSDLLAYVKREQKNALLSIMKTQLKRWHGPDISDTVWMTEAAQLERIFEFLWPVEAAKNMSQVRQWIVTYDLQEHNKRIKVKPPPILNAEKTEELEAMFLLLVETVSCANPDADEDSVSFLDVIEAKLLSDEEITRWREILDIPLLQGKPDPAANVKVSEDLFREIACPNGYRASEHVTRCVAADGKELVLDPDLGWILKKA